MKAALVVALLVGGAAQAGQREFGFVWTAQQLAPQAREGFVWFSPRVGRAEAYTRFDVRAGFGLSLLERFEWQGFVDVLPERFGEAPTQVEARVGTLWRWLLSAPKGCPFRLLAQASLAVGTDSFVAEERLVAELDWKKVRVTLNAGFEQLSDFRARDLVPFHFEQGVAVGYRLPVGVLVGVEWLNRLGVGPARGARGFQGSAVYVGPSASGRAGPVWLSLSAVTQVASWKRPDQVGNGERLEVLDNERVLVRAQVGLELP